MVLCSLYHCLRFFFSICCYSLPNSCLKMLFSMPIAHFSTFRKYSAQKWQFGPMLLLPGTLDMTAAKKLEQHFSENQVALLYHLHYWPLRRFQRCHVWRHLGLFKPEKSLGGNSEIAENDGRAKFKTTPSFMAKLSLRKKFNSLGWKKVLKISFQIPTSKVRWEFRGWTENFGNNSKIPEMHRKYPKSARVILYWNKRGQKLWNTLHHPLPRASV